MKGFENGKEPEKKEKLKESELEKISAGRISIISPGEGVPSDYTKNDEPKDGGATGGW